MKFGGLSETEVESISAILDREKIPFEIGSDQEIVEFNQASLENNLRYIVPPNLSTHILAISILDEDFQRLSETAKKQLLDHGITDQAPLAEDFIPHTGESIHKELVEGSKRVVAFNLKHQIIAVLVAVAIVGLIKMFWIN